MLHQLIASLTHKEQNMTNVEQTITLPVAALDTALLDAAMNSAPAAFTSLRAKIDFATMFSALAFRAVEDAAKQYQRTANARKAANIRHLPAASVSADGSRVDPVYEAVRAANFAPETPATKPKRVRRTKAEIAAAAAAMAAQPAVPPPMLPQQPRYLGTDAPAIPPPSDIVPAAPTHAFGAGK
jgi:hypothetical protein